MNDFSLVFLWIKVIIIPLGDIMKYCCCYPITLADFHANAIEANGEIPKW